MIPSLGYPDNMFEELQNPLVIHWFRRDLRLTDNTALRKALASGYKVIPLYIFDEEILKRLDAEDKRISFICQAIENLNNELVKFNSGLTVIYGSPLEILKKLSNGIILKALYTNHDYEPYTLAIDLQVSQFLKSKGIDFFSFKDQVIFEKDELLNRNGKPFTVFTPYRKKWDSLISEEKVDFNLRKATLFENFAQKFSQTLLQPCELEFNEHKGLFKPPIIDKNMLINYERVRNYPSLDGTSRLSVHLRYGTVSIRQLVAEALEYSKPWLNELQWREFFTQILWHFPKVVKQPFKQQYERIQWVNNEMEFSRWCSGITGFPLVDAGMRELLETGFMHNRVRMITASFLVKHLLIDWRWGEEWFANKLLDYDLASNNGNWQWVAGCGCDAAPYFRIFNPFIQAERFDPDNQYIRKWIPEYSTPSYPKPMIEHAYARDRCLKAYSEVR